MWDLGISETKGDSVQNHGPWGWKCGDTRLHRYKNVRERDKKKYAHPTPGLLLRGGGGGGWVGLGWVGGRVGPTPTPQPSETHGHTYNNTTQGHSKVGRTTEWRGSDVGGDRTTGVPETLVRVTDGGHSPVKTPMLGLMWLPVPLEGNITNHNTDTTRNSHPPP